MGELQKRIENALVELNAIVQTAEGDRTAVELVLEIVEEMTKDFEELLPELDSLNERVRGYLLNYDFNRFVMIFKQKFEKWLMASPEKEKLAEK